MAVLLRADIEGDAQYVAQVPQRAHSVRCQWPQPHLANLLGPQRTQQQQQTLQPHAWDRASKSRAICRIVRRAAKTQAGWYVPV